ncbi:Mfs1.1 [Trametes coccinea BRFM310]|uniref:Mfs1.1 n=1 Tax=Trametes coccinea (strain BRFM310) TaxID=1353009 RepID=A0A1Y2I890_TRAC3|nr:Mfs1.1 [Trametes coccinea BRFM310]
MPSAPAGTEETKATSEQAGTKRGWRFWVIFVALCLSLFLTALDLASVYTALPSIIHDLQGADSFVWVSSAYTLSCSAVLPMSGRLADIFGRRIILLVSIVLFAVGSTVTAAAHTMSTVIIGRTIQGVGSGAIQVLVAIVTADLIPLRDRGFFQSITGATFSFASAAGPFIAGAPAQHATWRWLFYLNLPLCAIAFVVVFLFLHLRKPPVESYKEAFLSVDWIGNTIIIACATSCIISLTWAGLQHPWSSAQVIAPLVIGVAGLFGALVYDAYVAAHPVIPTAIIKHRTTLGGYIGSFFHILITSSIAFYLPTYFQAAKLATPLLSGLYIFPTAICISPAAIVQGILVSKTGKYRLISLVGWCSMTIGVGLLTLLKPDTPVAVTIPFQVIAAIGFGFVYATTFSVLAPLPPTQNAAALSFLLFMRTFSSAWASSISGTIFQNRLHALLPTEFLTRLPHDQDVTYSGIPLIPGLEEPLRDEVRAAFADSVRLVWYICLGLCAAGFVSVAMQKHVPLHAKMDDRFGMKEKAQARCKDMEMGESKQSDADVPAQAGEQGRPSPKESVVDIQEVTEVPK